MRKIQIKTEEEIEIMRESGRILANILREVGNMIEPGVSTGFLNAEAEKLCAKYDVTPAFKDYNGFPASVCIGKNDKVVHGIPSNEEILEDGDIVSLDMGVIYREFYSDHAITFGVGNISESAKNLLKGTELARDAGIANAIAGNHIGDIGYAMSQVAQMFNISVVPELVGHGIGRHLHEDPEVPGFGNRGEGMLLQEGLVIAIEAIMNEGNNGFETMKDGWTTRTKDGKLSAVFEHTVAITKEGPDILTSCDDALVSNTFV